MASYFLARDVDDNFGGPRGLSSFNDSTSICTKH